jgi:hypothetical protein
MTGAVAPDASISRNAAILTESVRDDIRIVADGLAAVSAKIDALRGGLAAGYRRAAGHSRQIGGSTRRVPRTSAVAC